MATVTQWTPFGVALNITATAGTVTRTSATKYTVKINASWESYWSSAKTNYGMKASSGGGSAIINPFGTKASSGSGSFTGTYSISGNGSATKTITVTFQNYNTDNGDSATKTVSFNVTVPAWTSYTVKYNANGGSGAPSSQTKWKDQTLTLSTTKPTRTGYTFKGWATSASGSVAYASGASYTANAAVTLYAVWEAYTYTVKYNANGGSGAPASQTKTYGKTLTLSSTKPTRTNYNFKGWGTSASSTTVSYAAGASYTANAAITLYAIWELAYVKPRISSFSVSRCNADGTASDEGTNALVKCSWACDLAVSSIIVNWKKSSDDTWTSETVTASGTSGTVNYIAGGGALSTENTYDFQIIVADANDSTTKNGTLAGLLFTIDCLAGGNGVAFGKPAELEGVADFGLKTMHRQHDVFVNDKSIFGTDADGTEYAALLPITSSGNTSLGYGLYAASKGNTHLYGNNIQFYTKNGIYLNGNHVYINHNKAFWSYDANGNLKQWIHPQNSSGNTVLGWGNYENKSGNTNIYGYDVNIGVSNIASPSAYRPYLRRGVSITATVYTAGFVTNSKKDVYFMIPITRPIIGSPTITVESGNGFVFRQWDNYTHGSAASTHVFPDSYEVIGAMDTGLKVMARFSNVTNATNNASIGIMWNGTITFS